MPIPLVVAAGAGIIRAGVGIAGARKEKRRKVGLIQQAYRNSADRLDSRQANVRQGTMESLAARGLLQGGQDAVGDDASELNSTDARITRPNDFKAGKSLIRQKLAPTTLSGQSRSDLEDELGLEWKDLDFQRKSAESDAGAAANAAVTSSIAAGIGTAANLYTAGRGGLPSTSGAPAASPSLGFSGNEYGSGNMIRETMSGIEDSSNWFGGIHGLDPLGPGSSWHRGGTVIGRGEQNADFNVGGG